MIPNKPVMTEKEKNQAMEQFIHGGERKAAERKANRQTKMYNLAVPLDIYQEAK